MTMKPPEMDSSGTRRPTGPLAVEAPTLLAMAVAASAVWLLVEVTSAVLNGELMPIDRRVLALFRDPTDPSRLMGPRWLQEMMRDFTALGGIGVLTLIVLGVAGFLVLDQKRAAAALLVIAAVTGVTINTLLKLVLARSRPDLVPAVAMMTSKSFPSGHSAMSAVVYLTCGVLIAGYRPRKRVKVYVLAAATFLALLVATSRVYLGVHWPTDVIAGLAFGAAWAMFCWMALRLLQGLGYVEHH